MEAQHLCAYLLYHVCCEEKKYIGAANFYANFCAAAFFRMRAGGTIDDFLKYKEKKRRWKKIQAAQKALKLFYVARIISEPGR
mgnify:CR=1 FL=1